MGFQHYSNIQRNNDQYTRRIASRLNMRVYDKNIEPISDRSYMVNEIDHNKVFGIFEQYGYQTAIFPGYYYLLKNSLDIPELDVNLIIRYAGDESNNLEKQYVASIVLPMLLRYTMLNPVVDQIPEIDLGLDKSFDYSSNYRNLTLYGFEETPKSANI